MTTAPRKLLRPGQVSTHLPRDARAALREAYETDPHLPRGESRARLDAVELVAAQVKLRLPTFFHTQAEAKVREDAMDKKVEADAETRRQEYIANHT